MFASLAAIMLLAAALEVEVRPTDGPPVAGTLVELTEARVALDTSSGRAEIPFDRLLAITPKQKPKVAERPPGAWLELADGSLVVAADYSVQQRKGMLTLLDGQQLELSPRDVAHLRLQPLSPALANEWARITAMEVDSDVLVVRKEDRLDYHKGIVKDVNDKTVDFEVDGEVIPVKRARVFGVVYYRAAGRQLPAASAVVVDGSGSRWSAVSVTFEDQLRFTTPLGLKLSLPPQWISQLDFSGGKVIYLSDLQPESVKFTPLFATDKPFPALEKFFAPRADRNFDGDPLRIAGQEFTKGLCIHSRTEVIYRLPGKFSRLKAVAGIDSAVRPRGDVQLVIRADDRVLLDKTFTGRDQPEPIDLDITGARRLVILVDFGPDGSFECDHLDLGDARVIK
jgi:hypothetical protein